MRWGKSSAKRDMYSNKYLHKKERCHVTNLTLHLKELEKQEQTKLKVNRRKELIKIKAEINVMDNRKTIENINYTKSWFFEKVNKIDEL